MPFFVESADKKKERIAALPVLIGDPHLPRRLYTRDSAAAISSSERAKVMPSPFSVAKLRSVLSGEPSP